MNNFGTNIPDYSIPLVDQNGAINQVWWRFFVALFNRTGATAGGNLPDANDMSASLDVQWPPARDYSNEIEGLQLEVAALQNNVTDSQRRLDDFQEAVSAFVSAPVPISPEGKASFVLLNSWVNFGAPYSDAQYYRDPFGLVRLSGAVKDGSVGTDIVICTLPQGYLPLTQTLFSVESLNATGSVYVKTNGDVVATSIGAGAALWLDNIIFKAA